MNALSLLSGVQRKADKVHMDAGRDSIRGKMWEAKAGKLVHFHTDEALDVPAMAQDLFDAHQLNHVCF